MAQPSYSCSQCQRWFKNKSGLTQHIHAAHPIISHSRSPPPFEQDEPGGEPAEDRESPQLGPHSPLARFSSPLLDVHNMFVGPDSKLYRNYHTLIDGKLVWFITFIVSINFGNW